MRVSINQSIQSETGFLISHACCYCIGQPANWKTHRTLYVSVPLKIIPVSYIFKTIKNSISSVILQTLDLQMTTGSL